MAERAIFAPASEAAELVKEMFFPIEWHPGFAPIQKQKNVEALHAAAAAGFSPLLEISSKSKKMSEAASEGFSPKGTERSERRSVFGMRLLGKQGL